MIERIKLTLYRIEDYIEHEVHNPLSTMTNLTYVLFGWILLSSNIVLGSLLIALGIASTGFHWVRNDCWHKADIVAIYYVFAVSASFLWFGNAGIPFGFILGGLAHYSFEFFHRTFERRLSQGVIGFLGVLCIIPYYIDNGFWDSVHMLTWFALALAVSQIASRFDTDEDGIVYDCFHAIWHIFSGIGIFYLIT